MLRLIGLFYICFLCSVPTAYSEEGSRLQFRLVHPNNDTLPDCDRSIREDEIRIYECLRKSEQSGKGERKTYWVDRSVELDGRFIRNAKARTEKINPNDPFFYELRRRGFNVGTEVVQIDLEFNEAGSERLKDLTTKNAKRQLAIILDGQLIRVGTILEPIMGGSLSMTWNSTAEEAERIAERIRKIANVNEK